MVTNRLSTRTLRNRLIEAEMASRRCPLLVDYHLRFRWAWCLARHAWNLRSWRKIQKSDEGRSLLHVTDGRQMAWVRHSLFTKEHRPTVSYVEGTIESVTIHGILMDNHHIPEIMEPVVVQHFDNHLFTTVHGRSRMDVIVPTQRGFTRCWTS